MFTYYKITIEPYFTNSKEQFIRPKGIKLLPVADFTQIFHMI